MSLLPCSELKSARGLSWGEVLAQHAPSSTQQFGGSRCVFVHVIDMPPSHQRCRELPYKNRATQHTGEEKRKGRDENTTTSTGNVQHPTVQHGSRALCPQTGRFYPASEIQNESMRSLSVFLFKIPHPGFLSLQEGFGFCLRSYRHLEKDTPGC